MRVLMTGATGFVGRATVLRLQRDGHRIVAWVRAEARARRQLGADVELVSASTGVAGLARAIETCEAVVNLAGEPLIGRRWTSKRRAALVDSRVGLTRDLAAAIRTSTAPTTRVLISASGIGYYGDRADELLTEQSEPGADFAARLCVDWEAAAESAGEAGVRVVCLRLGVVLGRHGGPLALMTPAFALGMGGPLGDGQQFMAWIHLQDATSLIARALSDQRLRGPINAVAPEPVRNREFSAALGRALHRPAALRVPAFALRALFGPAAAPILASLRVTSTALPRAGFEYAQPTLDAALRDLFGDGEPQHERS